MATPLTLLFIRHAQSMGNAQGRMIGHGDDHLSEQGRWQAHQLAEALRSHPPTHIYSSPLRRARHTTEILRRSLPDSLAIPIQYREELKEFQNGIFQGLTWSEASERYPDLCRSLESSLTWVPIPEAESLQAGRDRAQCFIDFVLNHHRDQDRVWIISHSWIMQQLMSVLMGSDRTWGTTIDYTGIFEFQVWRAYWDIDDTNRINTELWKILQFNAHQHLFPSKS
jgi:2,3-bisphosphoglycerate-dependent phosphoglycerate mutase